MSFAIVAAAVLTAAAPAFSDTIPESFSCDATVPSGGDRARSALLTGPDYRVSGRLKLERKADHDDRWLASGNAYLLSANAQQGAYLIVGGSSDFLSDVVQATLVIMRDGKRHRSYEVGMFKTDANLRFTLEVDADGTVRGMVGGRSVAAKTDFQGQRVRVGLGCHRGAVSFSTISTAPKNTAPAN